MMNILPSFRRAGLLIVPVGLAVVVSQSAQAEDLWSFAILAGTAITNTGSTVINGNIGVSPGTALTGFPPGVVVAPYAIHLNDGVAIQAKSDLVTAYNDLAGRPTTVDMTGQDLAGKVLGPGIYSYNTSAQLSGTLTLDAQGNPNAVFIINVGSTLTTGSGAAVALVNGAQGGNVYFVVGSSATLGTSTSFAGQILALTSITLNTAATINCGAAMARNGAVTLDTNTISVCTTTTAPLGTVLGGTTGGDSSGGGSGTGGTTPVPTNALSVADGLDAYVGSGGSTPIVFNLLPAATLKTLFAELAGETATAVAPAGRQIMNSFVMGVFDRLNDDELFNDASPNADNPSRPGGMTVKALGYGPDDPQTTQVASTMSAVDNGAARPMAISRPLSIWASAYGDHSDTDGDTIVGTHDQSINTAGLVIGADYRLSHDSIIGVAVGAGRANFDLADNFGSGSSNVVQASIYGRRDFNAAYVEGAVATAWNDVSTERSLSLTGERFDADFSAYDIAGRIEAGYKFTTPVMAGLAGVGWLTPYTALQIQTFFSPSYGETSSTPGSLFALDYDSNTSTSTHTELGLRFGRSFKLDPEKLLTLRGRLAWAHDEWSNTTLDASFQSLPGVGFAVIGTTPAPDSLLVTAGADIRLAGGFSAGASVDGKLAQESQTYVGTGRLSYAW